MSGRCNFDNDVVVVVTKVDEHSGLPEYKHQTDAGMDGKSRIDIVINPGEIKIIPLGIQVAIPTGYEIQVRPRSGLAAKHGITVLNSPGTLDSEYRNECAAILINHGKVPFEIKTGDRVCQLVLSEIYHVVWDVVEQDGFKIYMDTERGLGGFGSTGVK